MDEAPMDTGDVADSALDDSILGGGEPSDTNLSANANPFGFGYGGEGMPYNWSNMHNDLTGTEFNHNQHYGDYADDDYFDPYGTRTWYEKIVHKFEGVNNYLLGALILFMVVSMVRFHLDGIKNFWRRRKAAARYKRSKKDDAIELANVDDEDPGASSPDDEPTFFETLKASLSSDRSVECTIDTGDGKPRKIDVSMGKLEKVSEVPFFLQSACRYSGDGELAALSLVEMWLKERALIQLIGPGSNAPKEVGKQTSVTMVRRAKAFKVTILPPPTR